MAKLKGPLMSLGASGALGKVMVFFNWKGLDVVREYVVPSNPNTTPQQTQRAYITACVAKIHTSQARADQPLAEADHSAYAALATAKGIVMTWFNQICKLWIDVEIAAKVPVIYRGVRLHDLDVTNINITLWLDEETASTLAAGKFWFGTSKTNLIHSQAATVTAGDNVQIANVDLSAFLTAGVKYYFQFKPDAGDGCVGADSGIYHFEGE